VAVGAACLHEKIAAAPADLAAEGLFLAVTIGGIIALAQRAPQVAQALDPPGTAAPGRAAGSTAGDRPRAATGHPARVRLAPLTVASASPVAPHRGGPAGRPAALTALRRHGARAHNGHARPGCSTAGHRTQCQDIRPAA
jgi:hypothetical protein